MRREHTATDVYFSLYTWVWSQEINLMGNWLTFDIESELEYLEWENV